MVLTVKFEEAARYTVVAAARGKRTIGVGLLIVNVLVTRAGIEAPNQFFQAWPGFRFIDRRVLRSRCGLSGEGRTFSGHR